MLHALFSLYVLDNILLTLLPFGTGSSQENSVSPADLYSTACFDKIDNDNVSGLQHLALAASLSVPAMLIAMVPAAPCYMSLHVVTCLRASFAFLLIAHVSVIN